MRTIESDGSIQLDRASFVVNDVSGLEILKEAGRGAVLLAHAVSCGRWITRIGPLYRRIRLDIAAGIRF